MAGGWWSGSEMRGAVEKMREWLSVEETGK